MQRAHGDRPSSGDADERGMPIGYDPRPAPPVRPHAEDHVIVTRTREGRSRLGVLIMRVFPFKAPGAAMVVLVCVLAPSWVFIAHAGAGAAPSPCSHAVPKEPPPPNPWKRAKTTLAPSNPTAVRLCRYSEEPDRLVRQVSLSHVQARTLVSDMADLRPDTGAPGFTSCFFNIDPIIEVHLVYADGRTVEVWVPTGCVTVDNGDIARDAPPKAVKRLVNDLLHLTRTDE